MDRAVVIPTGHHNNPFVSAVCPQKRARGRGVKRDREIAREAIEVEETEEIEEIGSA